MKTENGSAVCSGRVHSAVKIKVLRAIKTVPLPTHRPNRVTYRQKKQKKPNIGRYLSTTKLKSMQRLFFTFNYSISVLFLTRMLILNR